MTGLDSEEILKAPAGPLSSKFIQSPQNLPFLTCKSTAGSTTFVASAQLLNTLEP